MVLGLLAFLLKVIDPAFATLTPWNGLTAGARLAFVDISRSGSIDNLALPADLGKGTRIDPPLDNPLMAGIYQYTHDAGARVHSDSWGGDPEGTNTTTF